MSNSLHFDFWDEFSGLGKGFLGVFYAARLLSPKKRTVFETSKNSISRFLIPNTKRKPCSIKQIIANVKRASREDDLYNGLLFIMCKEWLLYFSESV